MCRRFTVGLALLVGSLGTGCPELYGKDGYLDDAMEKDIQEQQEERRQELLTEPKGCKDRKKKRIWRCEGPVDQPRDCHWECE